ncbi:hypothetical protein FQN57_007351 [Myotisia sp. PD_48]|nr:hypothetical protein FQN57_007351 [Myotisia sp. PD_48]
MDDTSEAELTSETEDSNESDDDLHRDNNMSARKSYKIKRLYSIKIDGVVWECGPILAEKNLMGPMIIMSLLEDVVPAHDEDGEEIEFSTNFYHEFSVLSKLNDVGYKYALKLYTYTSFEQESGLPKPGGYGNIIIMEKLPGRNLGCFHELPIEERNEVRLAFARAYREFCSLGFLYSDPGCRNLMWDSEQKKCYFIDFEHERGLDPMVPNNKEYVVNPSDEWLQKLADESLGKDLKFPEEG